MKGDVDNAAINELLVVLDDLVGVADANIERSRQIKRRISVLRRQVASERSLVDIVRSEPRPLVVELITENISALNHVGARLRWSEATALKQEGITVAEIARLFDVSRQRVSDLLLNPPASVVASSESSGGGQSDAMRRSASKSG
ncbi:MAG: hypothetical protein OEO17_11630 [Gemmatimonadota bacterium]|nr:hypothetical protein [Gemmatimonadota bacterium]MDH3570478.1 hypothetical protein [Gemmatimonadota bacterium]MDH5615058.1 hypothetical protein [Acidimicrobiia bacterium]